MQVEKVLDEEMAHGRDYPVRLRPRDGGMVRGGYVLLQLVSTPVAHEIFSRPSLEMR